MFKEQDLSTTALNEHIENYDVESTAIQRKLQSKVEALNIVKRQMEQFRTERDQFKLMAETLQLRYSAIKRSLNEAHSVDYTVGSGLGGTSTVATMVSETREKNIALNTEVEALRQRVDELQGDIRVLRDKLAIRAKHGERAGSIVSELSDGGDFAKKEKSELIAQLEILKKKNTQMKYDFRILLDEKEEVVMDRDAYKCKVHRLNHELNVALKGNGTQVNVLDIDSLILENTLLQERLNNTENELELSQQSCAKYKTMLDSKRKKGIIKLGTNQSDMIMSHKQVKTLLENGTISELPTKAETINDLKSLCLALLDSLNDKTLALSHQKRANKILATRISQLEQKVLALCGQRTMDDDDGNGATLSPSAILLKGYSPASVDHEIRKSSIGTDLTDLRRRLAEIDDDSKRETGETVDKAATVAESLELEQLSNTSAISEQSMPTDFDESSEYPTGSDTRSNSDRLEADRNDKDIKIDLDYLPADVVTMIREALNGVNCEAQGDNESSANK